MLLVSPKTIIRYSKNTDFGDMGIQASLLIYFFMETTFGSYTFFPPSSADYVSDDTTTMHM